MNEHAKNEPLEALTDADLDTATGAEKLTNVLTNNVLEPRVAASGSSFGPKHKKWLTNNWSY